jgi:type I restriction enzyme R subunit
VQLIALAGELREPNERSELLGLSGEDLAFYDALETNNSAVVVLGEPALAALAREIAVAVRKNATIDWTLRENVRAQLRVVVKRIVRRHGYPPDLQEQATRMVLEQAEALADSWAASM